MILGFNVHPVHFGIIATVNTSAGLLTPPFGLNVFVAGAAFGVPIERIFKAVIPFLVIYLMVIFIVTYLSDVILFLPRILGFMH
jgi:C4-dicarboxylate transporter DctM subunit